MLLRLRSDPGPPSAPAPDDIFRVTGSSVILVVGHATSSDRTRKKWRAFVASSIGEASSCCRCRRSLSVWVCLSLHWVRSYREVFLAFIKSVLWTKILFIFSVTHQNTMCVSLSSRTKGVSAFLDLLKIYLVFESLHRWLSNFFSDQGRQKKKLPQFCCCSC